MKAEWVIKKLDDLGQIFSGNSINENEKKTHFAGIADGIPYIGTKDVGFNNEIEYNSGVKIPSNKNIGFKLAPENTIFICAEGGSAGRKIAITDREVYFGNKLFAICPTSEISNRFVYYYCLSESFSKQFINNMAGLIGGVSLNKFKDIQLPIPPLSEQKRIVKILDEVFEAINKSKDNYISNLINTKSLFESHLESIYSQIGDDWTETTLEKILINQPRNGWSPPAANHSDSGTPVLTLSSVTGFNFRPDKYKYTSAKTEASRHYWVKNDDLLITRSNTPELVGHVAIAQGIEKPTIYPDLIMRMNPDPNKALTRFIYYHLRTLKLRNIITGRAQGANPTMKKISKKAVQTLPIHIPSISNQIVYVNKLDDLSEKSKKLEEIYKMKIANLDMLKQSILDKAFQGEL